MRPSACLAAGVVLLAFEAGSPRAQAQGYTYAARPAVAAGGTYYYAPRRRATTPAPTYYVQPRTYYVQPRPTGYYYTAPQPRGLLRVRKYPVSNTTYSNYILVDPNNRHWTFDYDQWMAHNF
jgi:hypothetical protein